MVPPTPQLSKVADGAVGLRERAVQVRRDDVHENFVVPATPLALLSTTSNGYVRQLLSVVPSRNPDKLSETKY